MPQRALGRLSAHAVDSSKPKDMLNSAGPNTRQEATADSVDRAERARLVDMLLRVAMHQDRSAFEELFNFYAPRLKGRFVRCGVAPFLAEDIAQDVMVTVWQKAASFDPQRGGVSSWIYRIASNKRVDAFRRSSRAKLDAFEPMLQPVGCVPPDTKVFLFDIEKSLAAAMAHLPQRQMQVLQLAFYDGLSHREVASLLHLPLGTVKSRIKMAMSAMRPRLVSANLLNF